MRNDMGSNRIICDRSRNGSSGTVGEVQGEGVLLVELPGIDQVQLMRLVEIGWKPIAFVDILFLGESPLTRLRGTRIGIGKPSCPLSPNSFYGQLSTIDLTFPYQELRLQMRIQQ